ncbi:hypothetical protein [Olivibacter sp. XZL3]|uniref:hypothetical protein n=1 Tax=Olivibacter sp. XZL3 TaxID=1735116 RepID=UPI0010661956|nr:hypothetical protein [Olivibacter sp. XZL3]
MALPTNYSNNVFINCPFDPAYHQMFEAIVFAIHDCGFIPRCAREEEDGGDLRFNKLIRIIDDCRYGIHDISKADLDANTQLARFNMPLELGLFIGAQRYAANTHHNKEKKVLVMDAEAYRYQQFISDLAGTDISSHQNSPNIAITKVRDFLFNNSRRKTIASGEFISQRFHLFVNALPAYCDTLHWERNNLTFIGYSICVTEWIKENPI